MIDFGIWLNKHEDSFDKDCIGLFRDSYSCFKHELDRPAFMLAYQGMMWHLRSVLLNSVIMPQGYVEGEWEAMKKDLRDDDQWDKKMFEYIQRLGEKSENKLKEPVFPLRADLREAFKHWKMLRNASAHYKEYDVHGAHVLAIYSFIEQYLETITVEGSALSLAQKIDDFLNPAITSPNADISPLIAKMDTMVRREELDGFLDKVKCSVKEYTGYMYSLSLNDKMFVILKSMLNLCSKHKDGIVSYLNSDENKSVLCGYLDRFPKDISTCISDNAEAYKFWRNKLPCCRHKLSLLAGLLRARLVTGQDADDAIKWCLEEAEKSPSSSMYDRLSDDDKSILWDRGYFKKFLQLYFNAEKLSERKKFDQIQRHTGFYTGTISIMPKFERDYVEALISIFTPTAHPWGIRDYLKERYREDQVYREALDKVCQEESLELPESLL